MLKIIGIATIFFSIFIAFFHMIVGVSTFGIALCFLSLHYFKQKKREWFVAIVYLLLGMTLVVLAFILSFSDPL